MHKTGYHIAYVIDFSYVNDIIFIKLFQNKPCKDKIYIKQQY
jgi:hypothetical protein